MSQWNRYFARVAFNTADLSYAVRLKVGAVAERDNRIICCGYNGSAPGRNNTCEYEEGGELKTKSEVIHAEQNLIAFAAKEGISLKGANLYITHSPCIMCAPLILAAGFSKVFYVHEYRSNQGINFLIESKIPVVQLQ